MYKKLIIASISLALSAGDIERFAYRADQVSKSVRVKINNYIKTPNSKEDNRHEQRTDYLVESNGNTFSLGLVAKGFKNLEQASKTKHTDKKSFVAFQQQIWLGRELVLERDYERLTEDARESLTSLIREYRNINETGGDTAIKKQKLKQLTASINEINILQRDKRTMAGGYIEFLMRDLPILESKDPTRTLKFDGNILEGRNPHSNIVGFGTTIKGLEQSWDEDSRSGIKNLEDLHQIGLIDNTSLKCARVSLHNLPVDVWWPGEEAGGQSSPFAHGIVMPGWEGGPKSVVVGKSWVGPEFQPGRANNERGVQASTFMVPANNKTPMNIQIPYKKPEVGKHFSVPGELAEIIFPIAGLDENERVFVLTWVAINGKNGLLVMVQYDDESKPRLAYVDPSGVIFRIKDETLEVGVRSFKKKNNDLKNSNQDVFLWNSNNKLPSPGKGAKTVKSSPYFKTLKSMGPYRHEERDSRQLGNEWKIKVNDYVMPRAMW